MKEDFSLCPCRVWENIKLHPIRVLLYLLLGGIVFWLDQEIKNLIIDGFRYEGSVISIVYVLNDGVAFSMFSFLGETLKWIQLFLVIAVAYCVLVSKDFLRIFFAFSLIVGSGASNLYDRFVMGGVVDYIYWHYKFEFAIFNFADVLINIGAITLIIYFLRQKNESRSV